MSYVFKVYGRPILMGLLLMAGSVKPSSAQSVTDGSDPIRFLWWAQQDARGLVSEAVSVRGLYAVAGMGGVLLTLSWADDPVAHHASKFSYGAFPTSKRIFNEMGNVKAIQPFAIMLFLGTLASDNNRLQDATFTSMEAIFVANRITGLLKFISGRARPTAERGSTHYRPFSGARSFPSGHTTTFFAFVTPWVLYYPNYGVIALGVLGVGTAFTRLASEEHWLTDVIVGSTIGGFTAYWLTRRHQRDIGRIDVSPTLGLRQVGVTVRF